MVVCCSIYHVPLLIKDDTLHLILFLQSIEASLALDVSFFLLQITFEAKIKILFVFSILFLPIIKKIFCILYL